MQLILIPYLNHAYDNILPLPTFCHQVLKSWSLGPKTSKSRILTFDLTLTSYVTSILSSLKSFGCVLSPPPPGTQGCASSPGRDGLTAFFNAHSHGILEDSRDSRRLVTFPTRDDREFCSKTGIPTLVPIRFRMIRFLQMCSGIGRTIRTQQLMIPRIAGDSGNSLTQHRLKGNMFSHNHASFFTPIPKGGGVWRFRGGNKHCQFPSTRRFGESSWDGASLR